MLQIRFIKIPFFALLLVALMLRATNVPTGARAAPSQPDLGSNVTISRIDDFSCQSRPTRSKCFTSIFAGRPRFTSSCV